jgi:hypothetical protein
MQDDRDFRAQCALAMIRQHGNAAADVALSLVEKHIALDAYEMATFWELIARDLRDLRSTIH